jgi:DNA-binding response OmpR family regulator
VLRVRDLSLDLITGIARRGANVVELTPLLFRLLKHLMDRKGEICSRKDISEYVWGIDSMPGKGALDALVHRLRAEIDTGFETRRIETKHWNGYRLSTT